MASRLVAELPTFEQLHAALAYDPERGMFTWKYRSDCPANWNSRRAGKYAGCTTTAGYISVLFNHVGYQAHCIAWIMMTGSWAPSAIDHKNMVKSDNRWSNLRLASVSQNKMNQGMRPDNVSGFKGVHWVTREGRWRAAISVGGQKTHIGMFDSAEAAHRAYCEAAVRLHGEFARFE